MPYNSSWMQRNPTTWSLSSSMPIEEFVSRHPPSKTLSKSRGRDGYMWVINSHINDQTDWGKLTGRPGGIAGEDAIEATEIWRDALWRAEEIRNDTSIPQSVAKEDETTRPSKQYLLQRLNEDTDEALRTIAAAGRWTCGKWLFFIPESHIDEVWAELATSIIDGPLSRLELAKCQSVKTAMNTNPKTKSPAQTIISLYFENCFNKAHATEVAYCCVTEHGLLPQSVKPDLWTVVGIDAGNDLKFRPTVYHVQELLKKDVTREARDFSALASKKQQTSVSPIASQPSTTIDSLEGKASLKGIAHQSGPLTGKRSPNGSDAGSFQSDDGSYIVDKQSESSDDGPDWNELSHPRSRAPASSMFRPYAYRTQPAQSQSGRHTPPWAKNYKQQAAIRVGNDEEEDPCEAVMQKVAAMRVHSDPSSKKGSSKATTSVGHSSDGKIRGEGATTSDVNHGGNGISGNDQGKDAENQNTERDEVDDQAVPGDFPASSDFGTHKSPSAGAEGTTITIQCQVLPQCLLM